MTLDITIDCNSAAFDGNDCGQEIARILHTVIRRAEPWGKDDFKAGWRVKLYDINGNHVGEALMSRTRGGER